MFMLNLGGLATELGGLSPPVTHNFAERTHFLLFVDQLLALHKIQERFIDLLRFVRLGSTVALACERFSTELGLVIVGVPLRG